MSAFSVADHIYSKVNESVVVSGCKRSGTTIMGKLIHSMEHVEYSLEPPMLYMLFPMISELPKITWMQLYEAYLYEDFFMNALAGRAINCNRQDDSSIYNCKSLSEIDSRLSRSFSKKDTQRMGAEAVIAYKLPSIIPFLSLLKDYYPQTKILVMVRDFTEVLYSILSRRWFSPTVDVKSNLIWPYRGSGPLKVPFFVSESDSYWWRQAAEVDRVAYYYIRTYENLSAIPEALVCRYEDLVADPCGTAGYLMQRLKLEEGALTQGIIESIQPRIYSDRDPKLLESIDAGLRDRLDALSQTFKTV